MTRRQWIVFSTVGSIVALLTGIAFHWLRSLGLDSVTRSVLACAIITIVTVTMASVAILADSGYRRQVSNKMRAVWSYALGIIQARTTKYRNERKNLITWLKQLELKVYGTSRMEVEGRPYVVTVIRKKWHYRVIVSEHDWLAIPETWRDAAYVAQSTYIVSLLRRHIPMDIDGLLVDSGFDPRRMQKESAMRKMPKYLSFASDLELHELNKLLTALPTRRSAP